VRRVSQQLRSASCRVAHLLLSPDFSSGEVRADPEGSAFLPVGTWAALYDASGTEVRHVTLTYGGADLTPPAITPQIAGSDDTTATPFTVAAQDGSGAGYRAIAVRL